MTVHHVFVDTPVFLTAIGQPVASTPACRALIERAVRGELRLHTAAECIQEVTFHRMRVTRRERAIQDGMDVYDLCVVYAMDDVVIERALSLLQVTQARGRDAFIAATALIAGFDTLVTTDRRFVDIPGLRRVDPSAVVA